MTNLRRALVLVALLLVASGYGCRRRQVAFTPPPPPPPSGTLIALLPDPDDGSLGRATVTTPAGAVDLTTARGMTRIVQGRAPTPEQPMDAAEVQRVFGDALSMVPQPALHFIIYFQFDSEELTEESRRLLPQILQAVSQRPVPDVTAVGHTDTSGTATSNYDLGLRRATIVRNLLVTAGLDAALIEVASHGEADLLVATPDETYEARNRRVEIEVR